MHNCGFVNIYIINYYEGDGMDIRQIIQSEETSTVEFKSWVKTPNRKELIELLVKEAVGFANAKGGVIFVGVEDDTYEITGCFDYDEQGIVESIYDRTVPHLFTDIEVITIEDKDVLKITVEKSSELVSTSKGVVYRRLGKNTKPYYPTDYHKRWDLKLPLVKALDRIQMIFEDRNNIQNVQMGLFKLEVQDYPNNVFQEALLNAMTHRDYESTASIGYIC